MIRIALLTFAFMLPCLTASAQDTSQETPVKASEASIADYTSRVLNLNKIKPSQNPQYTLGSRAISYRLLDQNRRGLGKVNDITIGENGTLESIEAEIIATGFNEVLTFDITATFF